MLYRNSMKWLFLFALMFQSTIIFAQEKNEDSYTIQRLIIFNAEGKVLLEKHKNGWMTPALRHSTRTSTNDGLQHLANEFGLHVSPPRLAGSFLFISQYKPASSFRQHYKAHVVAGALKLPSNKLDAQWFEPHEVVEMMSKPDAKLVGAVKEMTEQVLRYPNVVWGGTFSLWKESGQTKYRVVENFYPLF